MNHDTDNEIPAVYTAEDYFKTREDVLNATYRAQVRKHTIDFILIAAALIIGIVVIAGVLNDTISVPVLWALLLIDIAVIAVVTPRIFQKP